ncbi:hypothetical protein [Shewanella inventionis]|uniref:YobI-like P-loop NTPase domain-containing protein n=1 Tax=Shewanella inventionis TaxID=1738770 RepID=A0ABQ1JX70_9GAMM|nr:hypothetical protein [Shewanella inventionis]MCL1160168.1 hypothetical protein [Shewanella inventionis]GGB76791.1 hypothetical protein GCM10011607_41300 [Shewanella inventionis]
MENDTQRFRALTPVILKKSDISEYERHLLDALQGKTDKNVYNIAITGGYAVGKSSFLRTFMHYNPQYRNSPIISMAKFDGPAEDVVSEENLLILKTPTLVDTNTHKQDKKQEGKDSRTADNIETSILEQLLYSQPANHFPLSKYRRIREAPWAWQFGYPITVLFLATTLALLHTPSRTYIISEQPEVWMLVGWLPNWFIFAVAISLTFLLVRNILIKFYGFSLNKLTPKGAEFERIAQRSFLHENIDEIVYFFQKSSTFPHVVIFEDIDRLGNRQALSVLTHIREVNRLVNVALDEPVYFIYAVKDELFTPDSRTKFFDLIIPIIPVINSQNAYEKLKVELGDELTKDGGLDDELVENCSSFFDDLRQIYSLVNEYKLYKKSLLKEHRLDPDQLFAILVIKTLSPKSYSELASRAGTLYNVFNSVSEIKDNACKHYEEQLLAIREKKKRKEQLLLQHKTDYLKLFWMYCNENNARAEGFLEFLSEEGENESYSTSITPGSKFEQALLLDSYDKLCFHMQQYRGNSRVSVIKNKLLTFEGHSYKECVALLEISESSFDEEMSLIQKSINDIRYLPFSGLVKKPTTKNLILDKIKDEEPIIRFLVSRGYIKEDYYEYMSFFYPGELTLEDKNKVQQIKTGENLPIETIFNNPAAVVKKLKPSDFAQSFVLLPSVINELFSSADENKLAAAFRCCNGRNYELGRAWLALTSVYKMSFIRELSKHNLNITVSLFESLLSGAESTEAAAIDYLSSVLQYCPSNLLPSTCSTCNPPLKSECFK